MPTVVAMLLLALLLQAAADAGRVYYADSAAGSDSNDGRSAQRPWKTLSRVNAVNFGPGDKILLRAGARFTGQLRPRGSGNGGQTHHGRPVRRRGEAPDRGRGTVLRGAPAREPGLLGGRQPGTHQYRSHAPGTPLRRSGPGVELRHHAGHPASQPLPARRERLSRQAGSGEGHGITWENGGNDIRSRFDGLLIEGCRCPHRSQRHFRVCSVSRGR